jgi:hypothetical protein
MVGLLVRHPRLPVVHSVAADQQDLLGLINEGDPMIELLRKKPLTVETMLWDGGLERAAVIKAWVGNRHTAAGEQVDECRFLLPEDITGTWKDAHLYVDHQQTWTPLPVGHRIAREADGRGFYPLSPEVVEATYDAIPVDEPKAAPRGPFSWASPFEDIALPAEGSEDHALVVDVFRRINGDTIGPMPLMGRRAIWAYIQAARAEPAMAVLDADDCDLQDRMAQRVGLKHGGVRLSMAKHVLRALQARETEPVDA